MDSSMVHLNLFN